MKGRRRIGWWIAMASAVVLLVACLNSRSLLRTAGRCLDVGRPPQKADAVVLLNGGYNTRPFVAAALVHGGWAPKVILNTVSLHPVQAAGVVPPSHEIALKALQYGEVPRDRVVLLETSVKTTFDEARGVANYLAANPATRLLLVTEGPHTRRAEWIFRLVLDRLVPDRHVEIVSISAPAEDFDPATWWRSKSGFLFVTSEYLKLLFYALRYGWLGYEIAVLALAVLILRTWFRRRRKPVSVVLQQDFAG